jgi:hypothetical protein
LSQQFIITSCPETLNFKFLLAPRRKVLLGKLAVLIAVQEFSAIGTTCVSVPCSVELCRVLSAVIVFAHALSSRSHMSKGGASMIFIFKQCIPVVFLIQSGMNV